jgi:hypothetical protein
MTAQKTPRGPYSVRRYSHDVSWDDTTIIESYVAEERQCTSLEVATALARRIAREEHFDTSVHDANGTLIAKYYEVLESEET